MVEKEAGFGLLVRQRNETERDFCQELCVFLKDMKVINSDQRHVKKKKQQQISFCEMFCLSFGMIDVNLKI